MNDVIKVFHKSKGPIITHILFCLVILVLNIWLLLLRIRDYPTTQDALSMTLNAIIAIIAATAIVLTSIRLRKL